MNYAWDFNSGSSLMFNLDWTHMIEDSETYEGLDGKVTIDYTGQVAYKNFDDRPRASLNWQYEGWRLR
jgi:hypothetical protein